ncbi:MAG: magnesium transporter [Bacilli bacterium]|nr:magnesium transporter [Bacilli bacterium]
MDEEEKKAPEPEEREQEIVEPKVPSIDPEKILNYIRKKDRKALLTIFEIVPNIDIAEAVEDFEPADLLYIFRAVPSEITADFFDELSSDVKESLIKAMTDEELVEIINQSYADDVADTVIELPANLASKVLRAADKDMRRDINQLLQYADGTAGALMTTEYLEFIDSAPVSKVIEEIRAKGKDAETVYTIFVRNRKREFVGTAGLDDLIFAKPEQTLADIMNRDVVSCYTATDQEEVAKLFRRYDLTAMAVLNADSRLVGVITVDDAIDVMAEEQQEDLARLTNMEPSDKPYMELTAWDNAKKCIPWLIALLILGTFTTMVLDRIEKSRIFTMLPMLIAFVPTLMDTGGNAGAQTTGLMIRGLAVDDFGPRDILRVLWKEFKSALIIAAIVAGFAFIWILFEQYAGIVSDAEHFAGVNIWAGNCWTLDFFEHSLRNSALISITMGVAVLFSKSIGTLLPLGAAAIKKDPALLSQPMLTTIMDVATLCIFLLMAMAFFPQFA